MQEFDESGVPSWDAFVAGDWNRSLMLYEHVRGELCPLMAEYASQGAAFHRIRVVEEPVTPYLQWELNIFLPRAECGERIRVVNAAKISDLEARDQLREQVSIGGTTLYHVLYTEQYAPDGAVRYEDAGAVAEFEKFAKELYAEGEDFRSYFDREIRSLPPPVRQRA